MIRRALQILSLGLGLGCAARMSSQAPEVTPSPAPNTLPAWMLPIVRSQMARHWATLNELRWTAASLEFERTQQLARGIAREVNCGRPADAGVSLPEVIPPRYLELQEELGYSAFQLAQVAAGSDSRAVTHAYDAVVQSCAKCHLLYRHEGPPLAWPTLR